MAGNRLKILAALAGGLCAASVSAEPEWQFADVGRVVAVADIHGAYQAFENVLDRAGVIDDRLAWSAGDTYLVIVGDVVDRGAESRRALDLIMKLEPEAEAAGGRVVVLLGNHEIMNLAGDLRYVSPGEYQAFAADELPGLREAEFERHFASLGPSADRAAAQAEFDVAYPAGFFAHREAFSPTGHYGAWLLGKPVVAVIDETAFVHAGLADAAAVYGTELNAVLSEELVAYLEAFEVLVEAGRLSRTADLYDLPALAQALLDEAEESQVMLASPLRNAAERLLGLDSLNVFAPDGAVWYRGNVACSRLRERDRLAAAVNALGAARLVVGHTPTDNGFVLSRMGESLLRIDTGMLNEYYGGRASALIIEAGELTAVYEDEASVSRPLEQPRRVGLKPQGLSAEALELLLLRAGIETVGEFDISGELVNVTDGELSLAGLFTPAERDSVNAAVAAYRLDRLLGLEMVPVTIAREVDGVYGALQFWPPGSISETERSAERLGSSAWCPLGDQFSDMYLFDALIFNEGRTPERIRYSTDNFQLLLLGHDRSFAGERGRPAYLETAPLELTPAWRDALEALDETGLTELLGDVLDRRRIRALLARRDQLLETVR